MKIEIECTERKIIMNKIIVMSKQRYIIIFSNNILCMMKYYMATVLF